MNRRGHRQLGRARTCAACHERSELIEQLGNALICTACLARIKAQARHTRAKARQRTSHEIHAAFRNESRRKHRSER